MSALLQNKLAHVRRRHNLVALLTGSCAAASSFLLLLALAALLDWISPFTTPQRAALLAMNVAVTAYLILRRAIHPIRNSPDDEDLALRIEHHEPALRSRLISSIQFAQSDAGTITSPSLVQALLAETESL